VKRRKGRTSASVIAAAGWAIGLHLAGLAALGVLATTPGSRANRSQETLRGGSHVEVDEAAATWLGVELADLTDLDLPPEETAENTLPSRDQANRDPHRAAASSGLSGERRAPAPDTGAGTGREVAASWRRDASTLRARLTDGSDFYQPSREQTARALSSPQAVRREPTIGIGDSARPGLRQSRLAALAPAELPTTSDDSPEAAPPRASRSLVPEYPGAEPARGQGPLDADQGQRSFDAMAAGPVREDRSARAASDETRPGLLDYAAVASPGPAHGDTGRGPGSIPGLSSHRVRGTAPDQEGWPQPAPIGDIGEGSSERQFSREYLEIRGRLARVLRFPRRLGLLLEQGEAIVQFMVERDGRVGSEVKLLKSAGFDEFDREALEVVHRAAPFPPLPQRLLVRMRVPFENPIIR
jgi:TonB family protein